MTATSSASTCVSRGVRLIALLGVVGLTLWARTGSGHAAAQPGVPPYPVGERTMHLVDNTRTMQFPGHQVQGRPLTTVVRYPARAQGPYPLIVFGHGFAVTPAYYWRLLRAWTQAGFVVAAPVFPLENEHAPGGPDETDLANQPADMSFVISQLLAASANPRGPLAGLIDPRTLAVAGHSDGAETALATAADANYQDPRIRAVAVLAGAEMDPARDYFRRRGPALLAVQGTADTINLPQHTYAYWNAARRPKFLLRLLGAKHLPPYTNQQPQLSLVERVTTMFFDRYLKGKPAALSSMVAAGNTPGLATLAARR